MSILSKKIAKNKSLEKVNRHRTHIFHGQADIDDPSTYRRLNSWGSTLRSRYISLAVRFGRTKHTNCDAPLLSAAKQARRNERSRVERLSPRQCWPVDLVVGRGSVKAKSSRRDERSGARHREYRQEEHWQEGQKRVDTKSLSASVVAGLVNCHSSHQE